MPYPESWKDTLRAAPKFGGHDLNLLDHEYGKWVGAKCVEFCNAWEIQPALIAWHGHTIFHDPDKNSTCQIGHGASIAASTGRPVISQFRNLDVALGGQGAPLAPLADQWLLQPADFYINLGGICNMSFKKGNDFISWDVSPCNQILDLLAQQLNLNFDPEGSHASQGHIDSDLFNELNDWSYYNLAPPKSLDNSQILKEFWPLVSRSASTVPDKLNTVTQHIAHQIARVIKNSSNRNKIQLAITGGGAHNAFLLHCIQSQFDEGHLHIMPLSQKEIDFKEAALMALMGFLYSQGIPNVYHSVTGSLTDHVGGCLFQGWRFPINLENGQNG